MELKRNKQKNKEICRKNKKILYSFIEDHAKKKEGFGIRYFFGVIGLCYCKMMRYITFYMV